jgi:hypothetical protein
MGNNLFAQDSTHVNSNSLSNALSFTLEMLNTNYMLHQDSTRYEKWSLDAVACFVSDLFNITYKIPEKFIDLKHITPWYVNKKSGYFYCPVIMSKDKECLIMYSISPAWMSLRNPNYILRKNVMHRILLKEELRDILEMDTFDIDEYITLLPQKKSKEYFNADSVFFFNIPLLSGRVVVDSTIIDKKKYVYCTSMVISKYNRATIRIKCFFTEKGKKKEHEHIKQLGKNIWYNDGDWTFNEGKWFKWLSRLGGKGY